MTKRRTGWVNHHTLETRKQAESESPMEDWDDLIYVKEYHHSDDTAAMEEAAKGKYPDRMIKSGIAYDEDFIDTKMAELRLSFKAGWLAKAAHDK